MARSYTGEELIAIVRNRVPLNDLETEGTQDTDILNVLNEEAHTTLYSIVMRMRAEYFVVTELITLSSASTRYRINERAMQQRVRDVFYRKGNIRRQLPFLPREMRGGYSLDSTADEPDGFYFENNYIVLMPDTGASYTGYLEVGFYFAPGQIVKSTDCRQVATVNTTTGVMTFTSDVPSTWSTANKFDFHSQYSGAEIKCWSLTASDINGTGTEDDATFTATDIDGSTKGRMAVEVGDWICQEEEAALPGIPRELHPVLAQAATCRFLESLDPEKFKISYQELQQSIKRQYEIIGDRDDGQFPVVPIMNSPHLTGKIRTSSFGSASVG